MRIGAVLSPTGDWPAILEAAQLADRHGLDAIGFWDHYLSLRTTRLDLRLRLVRLRRARAGDRAYSPGADGHRTLSGKGVW